jgi:predicted cupin superfamily sugar epimerase
VSRAVELIEALGLSTHPEGGYYREVFRSAVQVDLVTGTEGPDTWSGD